MTTTDSICARLTAVRHMAARCVAAWASRSPAPLLLAASCSVLRALDDVTSARVRCGAAETLARLVDALQLRVVPYVSLLVVPLLGILYHKKCINNIKNMCMCNINNTQISI